MRLELLKDFDFRIEGKVITRKKGKTFEAENYQAFIDARVAKKATPKPKKKSNE